MPSHSSPLMHQRHHGGMQGPRPGTLKVTKAADQQQLGLSKKRRRPEQQQQVRPPVIIFVESPKVVHAHPGEFKSVVQRLTGAPVPSSSSMAMLVPTPPASAHLPPPQLALQFPFQLLYGQQQQPASSSLPAPADHAAAASVMRSLGFFSNDRRLIQLYDEESVVAAAGPAGAAAVQEPNQQLGLVPSSLGACYLSSDHGMN